MINQAMLKRLIRMHARSHGVFSRRLFVACQLYCNAYSAAHNYDMASNGERRLLLRLARSGLKTFFDVGANSGEWTECVLSVVPDATVHAFEISPATASRLQQRFAGHAAVHVNAFGLSDRTADVEVTYVPDNDTLTSLSAPTRGASATRSAARVVKVSDYLLGAGIETPGFVKLDVEGHELNVLRGFGDALYQCDLVQFEYNEMSWRESVFVEDFLAIFAAFKLGRLTNAGVIWDLSRFANHRLLAGNLVAVNTRRHDLIGLVSQF